MNPNFGVDRVLRDYFADDGLPAPDRVLDLLEERIKRQPQRRAWRVPWRDSTMNANVKPLAALAAVIVLAVGAIALMGRPSDTAVGGPTVAPSSPASPAPSIAGSSPSLSGPVFDPRHPAPSPLPAGIHSSKTFRPSVSFELTNDWVHYGDYAGVFMLSPDTEANRALEAAGNVPSHIDISMNNTSYSDPLTVIPDLPLAGPPTDETACAWDRPGAPPATGREVTMDATGFVDYLAAQDGFAKTGPIPVTVNGLTGQQITLVPEAGWTTCLPTTGIAEAVTAQTEGYRYVVLDTPGGGTLQILLFAPADFDAFAAEAMPVVESFEFDLSQLPSPSPS